MKTFNQWNTQRFALVGAVIGVGYGLAMSSLIGIVSVRTLDLLIWAMIFSASTGAATGAGVAVMRNLLAFCVTQTRSPARAASPASSFTLRAAD
ncbi:MAG TPA: hypothetical protein VGN05_06940 [Parvibaculum sp.]|jgi:hypothetical protein